MIDIGAVTHVLITNSVCLIMHLILIIALKMEEFEFLLIFLFSLKIDCFNTNSLISVGKKHFLYYLKIYLCDFWSI